MIVLDLLAIPRVIPMSQTYQNMFVFFPKQKQVLGTKNQKKENQPSKTPLKTTVFFRCFTSKTTKSRGIFTWPALGSSSESRGLSGENSPGDVVGSFSWGRGCLPGKGLTLPCFLGKKKAMVSESETLVWVSFCAFLGRLLFDLFFLEKRGLC